MKSLKIKVLIIEDNKDLINSLKEFLLSKVIFEVVGTASNGIEGLDLIKKVDSDVVLLDIVMPGKDGISILEELVNLPKSQRPSFIMFTAVSAEVFTQRALELGADYFVLKPFDLEILSKRIIQVYTSKEKGLDEEGQFSEFLKENRYEEFIIEVLNKAGIASNLKGYRYLKTAIRLAIENESILYNITKQLYPEIADIYEVNSAQVERSMRHAIGLSWQRDKSKILSIMPFSKFDIQNKPTNSVFLFTVMDLFKKFRNT